MEVLASYQRGPKDNRARYAADRTLLPSIGLLNESKAASIEMNETKATIELNPLNEMKSTIEMNQMNEMNQLNSLNSLNERKSPIDLNESNSLNGELLHPSIPIERFLFSFPFIRSSNRDHARRSGTRTADRVFSERCEANEARNRRLRDREKPERHSDAESDAQTATMGRESAHRGSGHAALSAGILQRCHSFGVVRLVCG